MHFAKKLLDETTLPLAEVAFASGFGSLRRFNSVVRRTFERTSTELRRRARRPADAGPERYRFRLAYRPPFDWPAALAFFRARATPGVECADDRRYQRVIQMDGKVGAIAVAHAPSGAALDLEVRFPEPRALLAIVERVRRMFDLAADPRVIAEHLGADRLLRRALRAHPGPRTPGAWDGFEVAVRAILGQQVSVRAATTVAGRLAALFGSPADRGDGLTRLFPSAEALADAPLERAGVDAGARADHPPPCAGGGGGPDRARRARGPDRDPRRADGAPRHRRLDGADIAMRALGEPDAFPSGDLVLRRAAGGCTPRELERRSAAWRPWRAYAVILLWRTAADAAARPASAARRSAGARVRR